MPVESINGRYINAFMYLFSLPCPAFCWKSCMVILVASAASIRLWNLSMRCCWSLMRSGRWRTTDRMWSLKKIISKQYVIIHCKLVTGIIVHILLLFQLPLTHSPTPSQNKVQPIWENISLNTLVFDKILHDFSSYKFLTYLSLNWAQICIFLILKGVTSFCLLTVWPPSLGKLLIKGLLILSHCPIILVASWVSPPQGSAKQWCSYWGGKGCRVPPLTAKNLPKIGKKRGKSGKIGKKEEKLGRKGKNWEGSFTLPLLTDRGATLLQQSNKTLFLWTKYILRIGQDIDNPTFLTPFLIA